MVEVNKVLASAAARVGENRTITISKLKDGRVTVRESLEERWGTSFTPDVPLPEFLQKELDIDWENHSVQAGASALRPLNDFYMAAQVEQTLQRHRRLFFDPFAPRPPLCELMGVFK